MHSEGKGWDGFYVVWFCLFGCFWLVVFCGVFFFGSFSEMRKQDSVSQGSSVVAPGVQSSCSRPCLELMVRDEVSGIARIAAQCSAPGGWNPSPPFQ